MSTNMNIVGKPVPLRDGYEKVTGKAKFAADDVRNNMLYARILGSPYPHAIVKKIDASRARLLPGVQAVITCQDVPRIPFFPVETREMLALTDHPRCLGDEIAAVAAESEELAEEAIKLIDVEYEILPAVFDPVEAMKPEAPKIYPEGNISDPEGKPMIQEWGNVEEAFKNSAATAEYTFTTGIHVHTAIEPRSCVVEWDGKEITARVATQFPHRVREDLARVMSLPLTCVNVISDYVGGGFGGKKQERYPIIAALLARIAQKPVKLEYTREDEHIIGRRRYSSVMHVKLAADDKGNLTAIDFEGIYDVGAYGNFVGGSLGLLLSQFYAYKFKNGRFKVYDVNTNLVTAQPFRGVQFPAYHFALEQLMDELAKKLNIDPLTFRMQNSYRTGDVMEPFGARLSTYPIEECIKEAAAAFGWNEKWQGWNKPVVNGSKVRGIGVGTGIGWCDWEREATSAIVKLHKDGTAALIIGTQDIGTNSKTTLCQLVAEELGLSLDDVVIVTGNTKITPDDHGCCASRTIYCGGAAAVAAARQVKEKVLHLASSRLGTVPENLIMQNKKVFVKGSPEKFLELSSILHTSQTGECSLEPSPTVAPFHASTYVGGAITHIVEVEVDIETGEVKILKYVAAHDVGRAINPGVVLNQIYGATIQGIGYALKEQMIFDKEKQKYLNPNYTDYKILTAMDVPEIIPIIVEADEPGGPFGAKGIGEHALNCTAGAIANAIANAVGIRFTKQPITSEDILAALRNS
ncbi:xanthine dehydrogenase family protein molybdopterin-binding subunit [Desulfallas sp. Bu1-1]|uniref:xanthine dehydrogenase family protein molybdopterin-binding subunit n=1 Tax=Desulfallas sp. Bu1-1 TaxID=2787620 RepID=UPI0018A052AF|nr:xanthine dehydrogenase family protein molybdopterin-binding subunit [Desulfallas sp. Bu1-1]MBF7084451.1 xanthine dehydrogenase family protein molybdopterin-binding subunit [Desulfallas sp. Bu1-1]